ncbi:MAG: hypothetical protein ACKOW9_04280 [Candidatus Paceibacterota bacterium]
MAKKTMSDMVPRKRVAPPKHTKPVSLDDALPKKIERQEIKKIEERFSRLQHHRPSRQETTGSQKTLWFIALVSILVLFLALSTNFSSAKVVVTPKRQNFTIDELLNAERGSKTSTAISFELVSMEGSESTTIKGSAMKELKVPARGQVVIYNTFSSAPQKLSIDTRLEGSNGKIYKTDKEIIVPGMVGTTPGSVRVGIYGYEPGESYNATPLDFKVFGFRGTAKYNKFYARSEGEIIGGLTGNFYAVPEAEKFQVESQLHQTLEAKLRNKIIEQVPAEYVLFKDALVYKPLTSNVSTAQKEEVAPVSVNGSVYGFFFKRQDIVAYLAKFAIKDYNGAPVFVPGLENLVFTFGNKENLNPGISNFNFKLNGSLDVVYQLDTLEIAKQLMGREKSEFKNILAENTRIDSAELVLRPMWQNSLPEKLSRIKVTINEGQK